MNDVDDMSYEGEGITLNGKRRHIKYTIKGLKIIAKKHGSVVKAFNGMQTMNQEFDLETMDNLVMLLHAGLIHEDTSLTVDDVENMLTMSNLTVVFGAIIKAFGESMPQPTEVDGGSESTEGNLL